MDVITFVKNFPIKTFDKGEALLEQGDISETLLAIRSGFIKVTALDNDGNERMLWIAGRYDIVPTERLFSTQRPLHFFYTALSEGSAYFIDKAQFIATAKSNLGLMSEIAASMSGHYDDLLSRINSTEQATVSQKLVSTLRYLAERFSADRRVDFYELGLRLTHEDLATLISSTRETVSLELQKLRQAGAIDYDRNKFVIDLERCTL